MPRKPRVEYEGAVYHVMCRGNGGADIFWSDEDRELFLNTLDEACGRCGWRIHAFVLMSNHYHILLETPEANLVVGMKWFQGTYTQRFNSWNKRWGHLFQGRYKALIVDGASGDYFSTLAGYIHLNPARAGLIDLQAGGLDQYRWSSYPFYFDLGKRPDWFCVDRVLGNHRLKDDASGLKAYRTFMERRTVEVMHAKNPADFDEAWKSIRRGWYLGDASFRKELLGRLDTVMEGKQRMSFSGDQVRRHDEVEAERLVISGLRCLGVDDSELKRMKKNCAEKYAVAWLVRKNTCVKNQWILDRLCMGKATNFGTFLRRMDEGTFGQEFLSRVKTLNHGTGTFLRAEYSGVEWSLSSAP